MDCNKSYKKRAEKFGSFPFSGEITQRALFAVFAAVVLILVLVLILVVLVLILILILILVVLIVLVVLVLIAVLHDKHLLFWFRGTNLVCFNQPKLFNRIDICS